MADPICPAGMSLRKPEGTVHPDEPALCIGEIVPQGKFMAFLRTTSDESAYQEVSKQLDRFPNARGDENSASFAKWGEARDYCRAKYEGGDLPTMKQVKNARLMGVGGEWLRDDAGASYPGYKRIFVTLLMGSLIVDWRLHPDLRTFSQPVGMLSSAVVFRCVAPPQKLPD